MSAASPFLAALSTTRWCRASWRQVGWRTTASASASLPASTSRVRWGALSGTPMSSSASRHPVSSRTTASDCALRMAACQMAGHPSTARPPSSDGALMHGRAASLRRKSAAAALAADMMTPPPTLARSAAPAATSGSSMTAQLHSAAWVSASSIAPASTLLAGCQGSGLQGDMRHSWIRWARVAWMASVQGEVGADVQARAQARTAPRSSSAWSWGGSSVGPHGWPGAVHTADRRRIAAPC
mmetsp:Transcript_17611/g.44329  ORF Transcript_17611/g.44329 Transcript_17611/m.44329 type:complete len:241 (+) Transcript_17611:1769-2491(+)